MDEARYARQIALFGAEGQRAILGTKVAIIGCGGLGSHVAQQLTYLGVRSFSLVDGDRVDWSNLNRLIGATPDDARQAAPKVQVLQRLILAIAPEAEVHIIPTTVISPSGFEAIRSSGVLFGCVDTDAARLVLTHACLAYRIPYFDLASEIVNGGEEFGGRVSISLDGTSCLMCQGELDQADIRRGFQKPDERMADDRLYGVERKWLDGGGPSVVSVNATVASLAVTEFMVWRVGLRNPKRLFSYYGRAGCIREDVSSPQSDCYFCKSVYGQRESSGLDQYLRGE